MNNIEERMTLSAKSLGFLRPIFHTLRHTSDLVLILCLYSRMGGHREIVLVDNESQLKDLIRRLPKQTILKWKAISDPSFKDCPTGIMPMEDGRLTYGAY